MHKRTKDFLKFNKLKRRCFIFKVQTQPPHPQITPFV